MESNGRLAKSYKSYSGYLSISMDFPIDLPKNLRARQFKSWLKDKGVQFADIETPGMHTWMVWRRNLVALAPQLFRWSN